jgi:ribonuclease H
MPIITSSSVPLTCTPSTPCVLGIDEAGRGPLLGPMVYGAAYWPENEAAEIAAFGFDDSKALTAVKREALFKQMKSCGRIGYVTHCCTAREISAEMLRRSPVSLNVISHDAATSMLELVLAQGVRVEKVFVDTVGEPGYYQSKLEKIFNQGNGGGGGTSKRGWAISFTVSKKADSLFKSVSAASIAAKVTRDASIRDWVFEEPALAHIRGVDEKDEKGKGSKLSSLVAKEDNKAILADAPFENLAHKKDEESGEEGNVEEKDADLYKSKKPISRKQVIEDSDDNDDDGHLDKIKSGSVEPLDSLSAVENHFAETDSEDEGSGKSSSGPLLTATKRRRTETETQLSSLHPLSAGSGYPGDEKTKTWALKHFDPVFGWPSIVRFSWAPARDALERDGVKIQWGEETQPTVSSFFSSSFSSSSKSSSSWLKKRRIQNSGSLL